jgi:hypothetical protein
MKKVPSQKSLCSNDSNSGEHVREQIRKQLADAFDIKDSTNNSKYNNNEIVTLLEDEIFNFSKQDPKSKAYRDRSKKIIFRLKGNRNTSIRISLLEGSLSIAKLCGLSDKELDDDNSFKKNETNKQTSKGNIYKPPMLKKVEQNTFEKEIINVLF